MSASDVAHTITHASFEELDELFAVYADDERRQVVQAMAVAQRRQARERSERERVSAMYALQSQLAAGGLAIGVDEVGRGAIAGPLTVGAVCLRMDDPIWGINDSKQLTPNRREELAEEIRTRAVAVGLAHIEPEAIDAVGMGTALRMAMRRAIDDTGLDTDAVLIDGNPVHVHPHEVTIVKGDARVACIAAASIVAKVTRDALMVEQARTYPEYHLDSCKGYASSEHIAAIKAYGLTPIHRATFCGNFLETPSLF